MQAILFPHRMIWAQFIFIFVVGICSGIAQAQSFDQCLTQFYQQTPPKLLRSSLKPRSYPLCFTGFAVLYSGVSRTPLWSAEFLSPERIQQAKGLGRQGEFFEETKIPSQYRSSLKDYARSGYDRGHMAPNGDMANRTQQAECFTLANMVPQSPHNNQEVWRNIEEATRAMVLKQRVSAYLLTGPVYLGERLGQVGNVLVPTYVYKAVYYPKLKRASAYLARNDESGDLEIISVAELEQMIGINLFPELSEEIKQTLVNLPKNAKQANKNQFDFEDLSQTTASKVDIGSSVSHESSTRSHKTSHTPVEVQKDLTDEVKYQLLKWVISKLNKEH